MRESRWLVVIAGAVSMVVLASVLIGLAYPDGKINRAVPSTSPSPTASPTAEPAETNAAPAPAPGSRAPRAVAETYAGRPKAAQLRGSGIDWCPAVKASPSSSVHALVGDEIDDIACTAISFTFEARYSRLSLPQKSYAVADFDFVKPWLTPPTWAFYQPALQQFVDDPTRPVTGITGGLVLFDGAGTATNADHATASADTVFYGPAFKKSGYRGRSVWINPTWSAVDLTQSGNAIEARFSASASLPVYAPSTQSDQMLTVPTQVKLSLVDTGETGWLIQSWSMTTGKATSSPLKVSGQ